MSNTLEERLRASSNAFEGLLALIPAKYYYDDKTQEQWKAKKKSKVQAREDKMKKLDPDQMDDETLSTLELMNKRESTAKPVVLPGEKHKMKEPQAAKAAVEAVPVDSVDSVEEGEDEKIGLIFDDEGNEVGGKTSEEEVVQPSPVEQTRKVRKADNKKNLEALRSKLQSKIQELKERRKAPGSKVKGAPSSREAILAERKRKLEGRKQKPRVQDEEEVNVSDNSDSDLEEDSDSEHNTKRQKTDKLGDQVMFQNIVFDDGNAITSNLQNLRKTSRKKGPANNDIKAHLKLAEARKSKLESKDELEQIKEREKSKWQRATLQAEGVKLKDDEKLLRKALKKKEAKKRKSSVDWKERQRTVATTIADKQKRREANLKIRRDNKGVKKSKQQKMMRKFTGSTGPKKSRAGFEGRLKSGKKK